jgi:hypothetical protein
VGKPNPGSCRAKLARLDLGRHMAEATHAVINNYCIIEI